MQQFLAEFLGHFHPVVVHLPIGILLIAALFYLLGKNPTYAALKPSVSVLLLIGSISALLACVTGLLLSATDDYNAEIIAKHQWLGIATAVVSCVGYILERRGSRHLTWLIALLVAGITFTGHLGGTLTHGDDYLTEAFYNYSGPGDKIKPVANVEQAIAYDDIIRPILETRCYSCHGKRKQKGGLRLDEKEFILKGGKNGKVLVAGDAGSSELVQRIFLAHENEDHMPPKEKPQPTDAQKNLIKWWVSSGASFEMKVHDLEQSPEITSILASLSSAGTGPKGPSSIPEADVEEAPPGVLNNLRRLGVIVLPVGQNSHYLSVNFINADVSNDSLLLLLPLIGKQLIWLKTDKYRVGADQLKRIGQLKSLTRLHIGNLQDSINGLLHLGDLKNLQYLNLAGAKITNENLSALKKLNSLRDLYLFHCRISSAEYADLKKSLRDVNIDTGGYLVPTFASDTTEVTAEKK